MAQKINLSLKFNQDLEEYLKSNYPDMTDFRIISKSLDARRANKGRVPRYNYVVEIIDASYTFNEKENGCPDVGPFKEPPIIVGLGPAGLFCALRLLDYGVKSIILERGEEVAIRMKHITDFWKKGIFNSNSNVCFGEGGAGLFSDGKLTTRIKSPYIQYVMGRLVDFGAPSETAYIKNPHLGTNKIKGIIQKISQYLKNAGCEIYYNSKVSRIVLSDNQKKVQGVETEAGGRIYSPYVVLATGHSARDIYRHLDDLKVAMEPKNFAVGVRIEHPRELIDRLQFGRFSSDLSESASYNLSYHDKKSDYGTYSFCMCPGGYVLSAGTEVDGIVTNGMSNFKRNSPFSNSALVVTVKKGRDFSSGDIFSGINYQREIENMAYLCSKENASGIELPAMTLQEFLDEKIYDKSPQINSSVSGAFKCDLHTILPGPVIANLKNSLVNFDRQMKGFISKKALLFAPETRTSSPITIMRDKETHQSLSCTGLFPCGEGAGHAGGITSSAVDGINVAMSLLKIEKSIY